MLNEYMQKILRCEIWSPLTTYGPYLNIMPCEYCSLTTTGINKHMSCVHRVKVMTNAQCVFLMIHHVSKINWTPKIIKILIHISYFLHLLPVLYNGHLNSIHILTFIIKRNSKAKKYTENNDNWNSFSRSLCYNNAKRKAHKFYYFY